MKIQNDALLEAFKKFKIESDLKAISGGYGDGTRTWRMHTTTGLYMEQWHAPSGTWRYYNLLGAQVSCQHMDGEPLA